MNEKELIKFLDYYGHLRRPFGEAELNIGDPAKLTIKSGIVQDAIQSYRSFHSVPLEHIAAGIWPEERSATPVGYGTALEHGLDEATATLITTSRCSCPDYAAAEVAEAGTGSWQGCYNIGQFHQANVKFLNSPPAHIAADFDTIWQRVVDAYSEVGLYFSRVPASSFANIEVTFTELGGSTIGLAIVGSNEGCQSTIWAKFAPSYRPANLVSEWTTLLKHELGHNCGLQHSNGGVMNPYIIAGLPVSWKSDVSFPLLAKRFGGVQVPQSPPTSRTLVLAWQNGDHTFEVIKTFDASTTPQGFFPT
jgi:hypothetical protein